MKIFLTGGTGFIGSYILMDLLAAGHEVTILARNPDKIPALRKMDRIQWVQGSLTEPEILKSAVEHMDACIHVALNYNDASGQQMLVSDTLTSVMLGDFCASAGVKHFIYVSSTAVNDFVYMTEHPKFEGSVHNVYSHTKQNPVTFYGATKAATENYLNALSYQSGMRTNFLRPGYTFGNPAIEGGPTQADTRFRNIAVCAVTNEPVQIIKHDGTQFIWAGHLSKIAMAILNSEVNRQTYFGLSSCFVSWEKIANEAVRLANSRSQIIVDEQGWHEDPILFDVSDIKRDFGFSFDPWEEIQKHLQCYMSIM